MVVKGHIPSPRYFMIQVIPVITVIPISNSFHDNLVVPPTMFTAIFMIRYTFHFTRQRCGQRSTVPRLLILTIPDIHLVE
jgi:hypothetical protein